MTSLIHHITSTCVGSTLLFMACANSTSGAGAAAPPASAPAAPPSAPAVSAPPVAVVAPPSATATPPSAPAPSPPEAKPAAPAARCAAGTALVVGGSFQRARTPAPKVIPDLCVDVLETTPPEYDECVKAGACTKDGVDCASNSTYGKPDKSKLPMVCIEYAQAERYCAFRGKRLPTTDEWEWAARGGSEARTYVWGNDKPSEQLCWAGKTKQLEACEVGSHPLDKSRDGLIDLGGNVLEFTTTENDKNSAVRIARGGAWNSGAAELFRVSRLGAFGPDYRCSFLGIRCVQPASPAP
ncbi:MAG: SUMF1/EgtB/PvdO family nonheme iron enzyme [Polyangiaceae bacterium]